MFSDQLDRSRESVDPGEPTMDERLQLAISLTNADFELRNTIEIASDSGDFESGVFGNEAAVVIDNGRAGLGHHCGEGELIVGQRWDDRQVSRLRGGCLDPVNGKDGRTVAKPSGSAGEITSGVAVGQKRE